MIIDFHTHIFPEKIAARTISALANSSDSVPYTDGTAEGLVKALERADADIAVALPVLTKPTQFESVTNFVLGINEKYKKARRRIISFGGIHPACDDIDGKMAFLKDNGIKGVKIHPDYQGTFIDDKGYYKIIESAAKYDMIVVTHAGVDDGYKGYPVMCPPDKSLKVIKDTGYDKIVLAHYGAHRQWQEVLEKLCGLNVYFDTAYTLNDIDEDLFKEILACHYDDKVLFATDCPWRDIKDDVEILKSYELTPDVEDKIFYKNALKLLGE